MHQSPLAERQLQQHTHFIPEPSISGHRRADLQRGFLDVRSLLQAIRRRAGHTVPSNLCV